MAWVLLPDSYRNLRGWFVAKDLRIGELFIKPLALVLGAEVGEGGLDLCGADLGTGDDERVAYYLKLDLAAGGEPEEFKNLLGKHQALGVFDASEFLARVLLRDCRKGLKKSVFDKSMLR